MDKATLIIESKTQGVTQSQQQLNRLSQSSKTAKNATDRFTSSTQKAGTALVGKLNTGLSKVSTFMRGEGTSAASKMIGGFNNLLTTVGGLQSALIAMVAIKIVKWLNNAADAAEDFRASLANIATLLPGQQAKVLSYGEEVQKLSVQVGKTQEDLSDATYQVVSAFGDQENVMDILAITAKASAAGLSTTTESLNLLSAVSKGYNDISTETISKISDLAFTTVRLGQTTFPELASAIGRAVPLAEALGVSMEELFAVEATLTGVTGSAAEVTTQLRSVMTALVQPTSNLKDLFQDLGVSSGKEFLSTAGGIQEALFLMKEHAADNGAELASYLGRVEGLTGALALTGAQTDNYRFKLEEMRQATGATAEAFQEQSAGINEYGFKITQFSRKWEILKTNIGQLILPIKADLADALGNAVERVNAVVKVLGNMIETARELTKPIRDFKRAFDTIAKDLLVNTLDKLGQGIQWVGNFFKEFYKQLVERLAPVLEGIQGLFDGVREKLNGLRERLGTVGEVLSPAVAAFSVLEASVFAGKIAVDAIKTSFDTIIDTGKLFVDSFRIVGVVFKDIFTGKFGQINEDVARIRDGMETTAEGIGESWTDMAKRSTEEWNQFREALRSGSGDFEIVNDTVDDTSSSIRTLGSVLDEEEESIRTIESLLDTIFGSGGGLRQSRGEMASDIIAAFQIQRSELKSLEEAYGMLGIEMDYTKEISDLFIKSMESMARAIGEGGVVDEDLKNFITQFRYLYRDMDKMTPLVESIDRFLRLKIQFPVEDSEEFAESLSDMVDQLKDLGKDQYLSFFDELGRSMGEGAGFGKALANSFAGIGQAILDVLPEMMFQIGMALIQANMPWAGLGFVIGSGLVQVSGAFAGAKAQQNAQGNAFSNGNIIPFRSGGVVDQPTIFPMANGGIGLMGEAGEEAVLPLSRTSSGDLGVKAIGGGSVVNIRVENHSNEKVDVQQGSDGEDIIIMIGNVVDKNIADGRHDNALNNRYGTSVRGVS